MTHVPRLSYALSSHALSTALLPHMPSPPDAPPSWLSASPPGDADQTPHERAARMSRHSRVLVVTNSSCSPLPLPSFLRLPYDSGKCAVKAAKISTNTSAGSLMSSFTVCAASRCNPAQHTSAESREHTFLYKHRLQQSREHSCLHSQARKPGMSQASERAHAA